MSTCPSSRCEPGATLLGVIGPDGRVRYISPEIAIDEEFVDRAQQGRSPERRFRFAGACVEDRCEQWTGHSCGVIEQVLEQPGIDDVVAATDRPVPRCSIRKRCRWFAQEGVAACHVCPLVITDVRTTTTA